MCKRLIRRPSDGMPKCVLCDHPAGAGAIDGRHQGLAQTYYVMTSYVGLNQTRLLDVVLLHYSAAQGGLVEQIKTFATVFDGSVVHVRGNLLPLFFLFAKESDQESEGTVFLAGPGMTIVVSFVGHCSGASREEIWSFWDGDGSYMGGVDEVLGVRHGDDGRLEKDRSRGH
ncbi:hypothetical protein BC938DRAFT_478569 [Jimgerdemannia flammicorona]|uniref:Uncharacterized protein n=1 Tax=Jimgerdemannia flammicorona TaxID=994334 RepID=A0A433QMN1_9FUNG|nr:hypothetical protein BC938DRAFT_478569 [Jimgerdemannia flammicorona]